MAITKATASAVAPAAKGDLVVGSATNDAAVLAVGSADQVLTVDSSTATGLKWATPANPVLTWTNRKLPSTNGYDIFAIAYNGSNLYVAAGSNGQLFTSSDALTWTSRTSGFGANVITSVAYGNGIFVAVGDNGTITTSTDGITWTARTAGVSTNILRCVRYVNNLFIAVGAGANGGTGGITTSTDGITWTKRTTPTTSSSILFDVAYGNGYYVATGGANTYAGYYSTDGSTWSVLTTLSSSSNSVLYANSNWYSFGSGTSPRTTGSNPTSTSWQSLEADAFPRTAYRGTYDVYDNDIYYLPNDLAIWFSKFKLNQTVTLFPDYHYTPIMLPIQNNGASLGGINSIVTAMLVLSSSQIIIGDDKGRIYTSF